MRKLLPFILFLTSLQLFAQTEAFNLSNCGDPTFDGLYESSGTIKNGAICYILSGTNTTLEYDGTRWLFVDYISSPCSGTVISTSEYSSTMTTDIAAATPTGALCGAGSGFSPVVEVPTTNEWGLICLSLLLLSIAAVVIQNEKVLLVKPIS